MAAKLAVQINGRTISRDGDPEEVIYSWAFPSRSNPDADPHNLILMRNGTVFCYCPRYRYKREGQPRSCRHFLEIRDEIEQIRELFNVGKPLPVFEATAPSAKVQKTAKFQTADLEVGITLRTRRMISIQ